LFSFLSFDAVLVILLVVFLAFATNKDLDAFIMWTAWVWIFNNTLKQSSDFLHWKYDYVMDFWALRDHRLI
jgi:hypothetical protein